MPCASDIPIPPHSQLTGHLACGIFCPILLVHSYVGFVASDDKCERLWNGPNGHGCGQNACTSSLTCHTLPLLSLLFRHNVIFTGTSRRRQCSLPVQLLLWKNRSE